jgi:hypothetical protein
MKAINMWVWKLICTSAFLLLPAEESGAEDLSHASESCLNNQAKICILNHFWIQSFEIVMKSEEVPGKRSSIMKRSGVD